MNLNYAIRELLKNMFMKLMDLGLSENFHIEGYRFIYLDPKVMSIMGICFPYFPIHPSIHTIHAQQSIHFQKCRKQKMKKKKDLVFEVQKMPRNLYA